MRPLSAPIKVSVDITSRCNLSCAHCRNEPGSAGDDLSPAELLGIVDDVAAMGVFRLGISGGEPFAHPHLAEVVRRSGGRSG